MAFDLNSELPRLLPKAISWAEDHAALIAKSGLSLGADLIQIAQGVGVLRPELIRVVEVPCLPLPEDPELRKIALETGLLGENMIGLTLGHSIYICQGHGNVRLLSHEFRHVYQYEQAGSIAAFLPIYLKQIATVGYDEAPLEIDARMHERSHI